MSAFSAVAVIGMPLGILLVNLFSWRAPFLFLTLISLVMIVLAVWLLPSLHGHLKHRQHRHPAQHLRAIFYNRNHLYAFALIAMLMFAGFSVSPFITTYMITNIGMSEVDIPYLYFCGGLATFYTARLFGKLSDQHGKHKIFSIAAALSVFPILMITHLSAASVLLAIAVSTLFMMLVSGRFVPAMALVTASVTPRLRGSFLSFNISIQQLSAGIASLFAGSIMSTTPTGSILHYDTVGVIAAIATVLSILLAFQVHALPE
jgi:predicted MFS family arabinose efflux permease